MDKEAQENIAEILECENRFMRTEDYAEDILRALLKLGYRKLPKDKPPLLRYQTNHKIIVGSNEWHNIEGYNLGAEAQREADIKHYEGK